MIDPIAAVEVGTARLDLPAPIRIAVGEIHSREYAAVRVTTDQGLAGRAYCLTREAPVTACVQRLVAPALIGSDSADPEVGVAAGVPGHGHAGRVGLVVRAVGLVDIALWDIAAQRRGLPLWKLLGAEHSRLPVMSVAAYPTSDRTPRVAGRGRDSQRRGRPQPGEDRPRPRPRPHGPAVRRAETPLPARDTAGGRRRLRLGGPAAAVAEVACGMHRSWPGSRIRSSPRTSRVPRPRRGLPQRIGAGDELWLDSGVSRPAAGIGAGRAAARSRVHRGRHPRREVLQLAQRHGVEVSFHIYPEMSAHVAPPPER